MSQSNNSNLSNYSNFSNYNLLNDTHRIVDSSQYDHLVLSMPIEKLTDAEIEGGIAQLSGGWAVQNGKLHRAFKFKDFVEAFGFITKVAIVSEKMDHHPELFNVYNNVVIELTTHDAGGISKMDLELAKKIDGLK